MTIELVYTEVTQTRACWECGQKVTGRLRKVALLMEDATVKGAMPVCRYCAVGKMHPDVVTQLEDGDIDHPEGEVAQ